MRTGRFRSAFLAVPTLVTTVLATPARAQEETATLRTAATRIAVVVKQYLDKNLETAVHVNSMTLFRGSSVGTIKDIGDELIRIGVRVDPVAPNTVNGDITRLPPQPNLPLTGLKITGKLNLRNGESQAFTFDVTHDINNAAIILEPSQQIITPPVSPERRPFTEPGNVGTIGLRQFKLNERSPYGIRILVQNAAGEYVNREITRLDDQGRVFGVTFKRDEIFAIELLNGSEYDAAVSILVDGLRRFAMSENPSIRDNAFDRVKSREMNPPGQPSQPGRRRILGFYRDNQTLDTFRIGEYSKSPEAKRLPPAPNVGTITVVFAAAWDPDDSTKEAPFERSPQTSGLSVVPGPIADDPIEVVKLKVGRPREIFKITYYTE